MWYWAILAALLAAPTPESSPTQGALTAAVVSLNQPAGTLAEALRSLGRQAAVTIDLPAEAGSTPCAITFTKLEFWQALEQIAGKCGMGIAIRNEGRTITLVKRSHPEPSSVSGPFRIVAKRIDSRLEFDSGTAFTDLTIDIHWEPRIPVFRIDAQPRITTVTDDRGSPITPRTAHVRTAPSGSRHTSLLRLEGVPRAATRLKTVQGEFTVAAAEKMLAFTFDKLDAVAPTTKTLDRVTTTLHPPKKFGTLWEVKVEMDYPEGMPAFESFESWLTANRLRLISPTGAAVETDDYEFPRQGRHVVAVYRFPIEKVPGFAGWSATYETPSPLVEFQVPFELKSISLP